MLKGFYHCFKQDLKVIWRSRKECLDPVLFFFVIISLFAIGCGSDNQQLINISPAVIWITFFLTALFTVDNLLRRDESEGLLEQFVLSPYPLWWLILAKSLAFWVASCLPLLVIMPLVALTMHLKESILIVELSLLLGSPAIIFLGMLGTALTITLQRSGILLTLLLLPLYIPLLILGESAIVSVLSDGWPVIQLLLLAAISLSAITLIPHATAAAIKVAMNE